MNPRGMHACMRAHACVRMHTYILQDSDDGYEGNYVCIYTHTCTCIRPQDSDDGYEGDFGNGSDPFAPPVPSQLSRLPIHIHATAHAHTCYCLYIYMLLPIHIHTGTFADVAAA